MLCWVSRSCPTLLQPLSIEFSRPESRRGFPFPSPGDLPFPEVKLASLLSHAFCTWILHCLVTRKVFKVNCVPLYSDNQCMQWYSIFFQCVGQRVALLLWKSHLRLFYFLLVGSLECAGSLLLHTVCFLIVSSRSHSLVGVPRLLIVAASLDAARKL